MKTVLTIAGSDASGGAGIQADIKTLTVHKVYATSCITALTAQNTKGITGIMPVPPDFFEKQMDSVFSDIKPDAVKIGMIASKEQVEIIAKYLQKYSIKQVVADPVMISTSGTVLVEEKVREVLYEKINTRVDKMVNEGLIEEAKKIFDLNIKSKAVMTPIGYKELFPYFEHNKKLEECIDEIKQKSRRYAKRQYTWFNNKMDINWFNVNFDNFEKTIKEVLEYIKNNS